MGVIEEGDASSTTLQADRCFLCHPADDLLVARGASTTVVSGLGPLCDGYCVVASRAHVRSLADLAASDRAAVEEVVSVRARLSRAYGRVLMTEHGRVPVCREGSDEHEAHCFHAHALMFPVDVSIGELAGSYYGHRATFPSIRDALSHARTAETYLLLSEDPSRFDVLTGPLHAPRQLARYLVAHGLGDVAAADWRAVPEVSRARRNAAALRRTLAGPGREGRPC